MQLVKLLLLFLTVMVLNFAAKADQVAYQKRTGTILENFSYSLNGKPILCWLIINGILRVYQEPNILRRRQRKKEWSRWKAACLSKFSRLDRIQLRNHPRWALYTTFWSIKLFDGDLEELLFDQFYPQDLTDWNRFYIRFHLKRPIYTSCAFILLINQNDPFTHRNYCCKISGRWLMRCNILRYIERRQ